MAAIVIARLLNAGEAEVQPPEAAAPFIVALGEYPIGAALAIERCGSRCDGVPGFLICLAAASADCRCLKSLSRASCPSVDAV